MNKYIRSGQKTEIEKTETKLHTIVHNQIVSR